MASSVPAITLTDPHNRDSAPSPARSEAVDANLSNRLTSDRPVTPRSKSSSNRGESANGSWTSPTRLVRSLSSNSSIWNHGGGSADQTGGRQLEGEAPVDPLSQHISLRTNTPLAFPNASGSTRTAVSPPRKDERMQRDHSPSLAVQEPAAPAQSEASDVAHRDLRKGIKAVSFLSRLVGNKKREEEEAGPDEETASNDGRLEGNEAEIFAGSVDNMGYSPQHPHPPSYIKMHSKNKKQRDFDRLFFAQELECHRRQKLDKNGGNRLRRKSSSTPQGTPVWAMEFSKDGKYLAAAGADKIVRIWAVISSPEERSQHESQESSDSSSEGMKGEHLSAPVFQSRPIREYEGHTSTILDLSWSKNNFLLSSSMDKTVRLWHISRSECLCTFKHNDFVPSISFHPKDDRFFLAGSLDSRLRLWSIPDKSVAFSAHVPDLITAVAFTPDGKSAMAGCLSGLCMFFETEGLKYQSQVHVKSSRGQNAKGSKITGMQAFQSANGTTKLLITSNDSRIRVYNLRDKNLELKLKGNENNCSQIHATLSDDSRYVVCGSEDRKAYVWSLGPAEGEKRDKVPVEMFEAHNSITTVACFAPTKTKQLLSRSEDPVYDLCNPPPVRLMSRTERAESRSSSKPPTETGSIPSTPADVEAGFDKVKESPAYLARSAHVHGNIVVTADFTGQIKVFRQDCAWSKRRAEDFDRASLFAKNRSRTSRPGSLATKESQRSLRDSREPTSSHAPADRILSWRQGIASSPSSTDNGSRGLPNQANRNISPHTTNGRPTGQQRDSPGEIRGVESTQPLDSDHASRDDHREDHSNSSDNRNRSTSVKEENPLMIAGGQSFAFWNTAEWHERAERMRQLQAARRGENGLTPVISKDEGDDRSHLSVRPTMDQKESYVSELSDERSTEDEFDDAKESHEDDMSCRGCGGLSFSARLGKGGTKLVCTQCGRQA